MKYNKNEVTGKMRDRIILQNVTRSRSLTGFASESWADTTTIWAFAESKLPGSNENIIDGKNTAKNVCDFTIRYISTISEESRVVFKNKIYQVKNIKISHDRRFISFQGVYYDSYSTVIGLQSCSASLLAQSSLSAALMRVIKYQASLNAFGSVSADIALVQKVASSLNAFGTLTADINFVQKVQASLTGAGTTTANLTVQSAGFDADAAAFFARVTAAGGTLTTTEQNAVNTLVVQMKADGIWTKMKAIYPMVGASAAACAQNLKSSSFTGTFSSGWTFASTGVTPNGTSAYMDSGFNPNNTGDSSSSFHLSVYQRGLSNIGTSRCKIGASSNSVTLGNGTMLAFYSGGTVEIGMVAGQDFSNYSPAGSSPASQGLFIITTNTNRNAQHYINNSANGSAVNQGTGVFPNYNLYIGAENRVGTAASFFNKSIALTTIGTGLTNTDAANFYTAVQAFQTTLNRQV